MGGRGRKSGLEVRQITINDTVQRLKIEEIIRESTKKREAMLGEGSGGGPASSTLLKKCACCGEYTIPAKSEYETCPICSWIDDAYQNSYPDSLNGKNMLSLLQAKIEYQRSSK